MLEANIKDEEKAIIAYNQAINKVKNDSLKRLLERIAEDENRHLEIFKSIRNNVRFLSL